MQEVLAGETTSPHPRNMSILTLTAIALAAIALLFALAAVRRVEKYRLTAPEVRELVREIEDALEKLMHQQARESMRRVRSVARPDTPAPDIAPAPAMDSKSELWAIAAQRGLGRRA